MRSLTEAIGLRASGAPVPVRHEVGEWRRPAARRQGSGQGLRFSTCLAQGCLLPTSFPVAATDAMKAGKTLTAAAVSLPNNEPVPFNISLTGFAAAFDRLALIDK